MTETPAAYAVRPLRSADDHDAERANLLTERRRMADYLAWLDAVIADLPSRESEVPPSDNN